MVKRICAWCGASLGPDVEPLDNDGITHGMCPECFDRETSAGAGAGATDHQEIPQT